MIDVSVITVTHESKEFIADQILSVALSAVQVEYEHFIVDNASKDGTADYIEAGFAKYARVIRNRKNVGFAVANNQVLSQVKGKYVLFLNPDMRLEMGGLDRIVSWMNTHPQVGIAGCQLLDREGYPHRDLQPRKFPSCLVDMTFFLHLHRFFPSFKKAFHYEGFDPEKEREVDSVRGAFMLVRKEVIEKLGRAFDPRYFLLFEDVDFCKETKDLGYRVYYTPITSCIDFFHRSFLHHNRVWKHWQMSRSLWVYAQKWYGNPQKIALLLGIFLGFLIRIPIWVVHWRDSFCKRT